MVVDSEDEPEDVAVEVPVEAWVPVAVVSAVEEVPETTALVAVGLTVLVEEYWLASAQYWVTRPA